jgi:flagellar hook-associated protein 3 FlgL
VTYAGNADQAAIALSEAAAVRPGSTGATNQSVADFINGLVSLRDSLRASDPAGVTAARSTLIGTEDAFVDALAEQGAVQMRIEVNRDLQRDRDAELERLVSAETDDDLASTVVRLNQAQVAYQAALQSSANIMRMSLLDYLR